MAYNSDLHHRRSIRLADYDYASAGAYFFTIVTKDRDLLFDEEAFRHAADEAWHVLGARNASVELDAYVVMPNHFHGILFIRSACRGGSRTAPTGSEPKPKPLGRLIGSFKTMSTNAINTLRNTPGVPVWQRNYYERIIRDDAELARIRRYIADNPANWQSDPENPLVVQPK